MSDRYNLAELKRRLLQYLESIGAHWTLRGTSKIVARCPLHEDNSPSFEATQDGSGAWLWFCHPCGVGGTVIDLHMRRTGLANGTAIADVANIVGQSMATDIAPRPMPARPSDATCSAGPKLPDDLHEGTEAELRALAALRRVSPHCLLTATKLGTLWFGTVCGFQCWILTDERRLIAEARRMDGKLFPAVGTIRERKAHTLKGSVKSWPVGLAVKGFKLDQFRALMAVEGGPDYLAALHFVELDRCDVLPVALLGAGSCREIHPEAAPLFQERIVRIYPHADPAGMAGANVWKRQLNALGANVSWFDLNGLFKPDGTPIKDLNDLCEYQSAEEPIEAWEVLP